MVSLYNEDFKYYKDFRPIHWTEVNTWDFTELKCATKEYINTYFNQPRFYEKLRFMENAKYVLDKLSTKYNIIIVSMGYSPNLVGKELWIKENIPYAKFVGCNLKEYEDKSHIDMSGGILIDDNSKNLITCNADEKILYGDTYPWNEDWNGNRSYNWTEVEHILL